MRRLSALLMESQRLNTASACGQPREALLELAVHPDVAGNSRGKQW
jgi:hypothetical protein